MSALSVFTCPLRLQRGDRGPTLSEVLLLQYSTVLRSPTGDAWAALFRYISLALRQEETVTEAFGTWQSPAEFKQAAS